MNSGAERISSLRDEILLLDRRLGILVSWFSNTSSNGGGGGKIAHSPAPWNAAAALCRMDLHALVRGIEADWRAGLGLPVRGRGGSDANTAAGLDWLVRAAAGVDEGRLVKSLRELTRWTRAAQMLLGDAERPRRLPAGSAEQGCPGCGMRTLRLWVMQGIIRCVNPACGGGICGSIEWTGDGIGVVWESSSPAN